MSLHGRLVMAMCLSTLLKTEQTWGASCPRGGRNDREPFRPLPQDDESAHTSLCRRGTQCTSCALSPGFLRGDKETALLHTAGWQVSEAAQLLCARMCFVIVVPANGPAAGVARYGPGSCCCSWCFSPVAAADCGTAVHHSRDVSRAGDGDFREERRVRLRST